VALLIVRSRLSRYDVIGVVDDKDCFLVEFAAIALRRTP